MTSPVSNFHNCLRLAGVILVATPVRPGMPRNWRHSPGCVWLEDGSVTTRERRIASRKVVFFTNILICINPLLVRRGVCAEGADGVVAHRPCLCVSDHPVRSNKGRFAAFFL